MDEKREKCSIESSVQHNQLSSENLVDAERIGTVTPETGHGEWKDTRAESREQREESREKEKEKRNRRERETKRRKMNGNRRGKEKKEEIGERKEAKRKKREINRDSMRRGYTSDSSDTRRTVCPRPWRGVVLP